jgi:hypothetical protein
MSLDVDRHGEAVHDLHGWPTLLPKLSGPHAINALAEYDLRMLAIAGVAAIGTGAILPAHGSAGCHAGATRAGVRSRRRPRWLALSCSPAGRRGLPDIESRPALGFRPADRDFDVTRKAALDQPANGFSPCRYIGLISAPIIDPFKQVRGKAHLKTFAEHIRNLRNCRLPFKNLWITVVT